jgi:hypothetical protein
VNDGLFGADEVLRGLTDALCHQSEARGLDLGAATSFVCARCTGIWIGVFVGALAGGVWARRVGGGRTTRRGGAALLLTSGLMAAHALSGSLGGVVPRVAVGGAFGLSVGVALAAWAWPVQPEGDGVTRWLWRRGLLLVDCVAVLAVLLLDVGRGLVEGAVFAGLLVSVHALARVVARRTHTGPATRR